MKKFKILKFPMLGFLINQRLYSNASYAVVLSTEMDAPLIGRAARKQHEMDVDAKYTFVSVPIGSYKIVASFSNGKLPPTLEHVGYSIPGFPVMNWRKRVRELVREAKEARRKDKGKK